jgi:hypothetical protein
MTNGNDECVNCGGDRGIHHYQTNQCPVGGVESAGDRPQEWKTSTFVPEIPFNPLSRLARDMTMREYFAAMAMQGMLAGQTIDNDTEWNKLGLGMDAAEFADALIEALNKESK